MRTVASLADVSVGQTAGVLRRLIALGLVERRDAGSAALVRLVRENEASQALVRLAGLRESLLSKLKDDARSIQPSPASLVVFGSFARGEARAESDVDVLAVLPANLADHDQEWRDRLGEWGDVAGRRVGNPVNLVVMSLADLRDFKARSGAIWREIQRDGILLAGSSPRALVEAQG
jgi:predicted nucleotidyltransferase